MLFSSTLLGLCLSSLAGAAAIPDPQQESGEYGAEGDVYDAIVVRIFRTLELSFEHVEGVPNTQQIGGGPAGLSTLSGLARVRRKAIMIDSGVYRNSATRHMHDVIGLDGK